MLLKRYMGDRAFYGRVLGVAVPIMVQMGITNFVSLLDNIMVGQLGNGPMSGVSIVNGLLFVFNLCIFGACSGAGIFTAQFHGSGDREGVRDTFRYKLLACLGLTVLGIGVFMVGGRGLIGLYLRGEGDPAMAQQTMELGLEYLWVMLAGLLPFALCNAYATTLRETGQTLVPMVGGVCAVFVNLGLNYVMIFGNFGAPAMGVRGAALATAISRVAELAVVAGWTHLNRAKAGFIRGALASMRIPRRLLGDILRKGTPLLVNEFLWAAGMAVMNQCYSTCGLDVVPAMNISSTLYNLGSVVYLSMGNAVGILMGQLMGSGAGRDTVLDQDRKLIFLSVLSGMVFGGAMAAASGAFPMMYNTTPEVRALAGILIVISGFMMPFNSYVNAAYFTLRSGGQTVVTFLFDSCYMWTVCVPLAFLVSSFTAIGIIPLYILCHSTDLIKCVVGHLMIKKGRWIRDLTK